MNVKELIAKLKKMPQDLEVYGLCDHGQSPEKVADPSIAYAEDLKYCLWGEWTAYEEDADEAGCEKPFVLL